MEIHKLAEKVQPTGLSPKASLVYAYLVNTGGAYPSQIASSTNLNRSTVYKILLELSVKGLATEIERGKKLYYQIEKPEKLLSHARDTARSAQESFAAARDLIPELDRILAESPHKPIVRYFHDQKGIISIYQEMVTSGGYEMLALSHGEAFKDYLPPKILRDFVKSKERHRIHTRGIIPDTPANRKYNEVVFRGIKKNIWPDMRYLSPDGFPFEAEIVLYKNSRMAIIKLQSEKLIGIVIEDKFIHDMFKMIFEHVWRSNQVKK